MVNGLTILQNNPKRICDMDRQILLTALEMIKPGIDDKDRSNLGRDNCLFTPTSVSAFNGDVAITYPVETGIQALVRANDLISLLKKMRKFSNEINLSVSESSLHVNTADSKTELAVVIDPEIEERLIAVHASVGSLKWMDLPDNFCDAATICSMAASKRESQFTLACVYFNEENALASDNDKVSWTILDKPVKPMLIKASCIKFITAINPVEYSGSKSFFHFRDKDGAVVSVRKVTGVYPVEYMDMFDFKGIVFSIPQTEKTVGAIEMLSVFVDYKSPSVIVNVQKGVCIISASNGRGSSKFKVGIKYNGNPFSFQIGPDVLSELLKHSTDITIGDNIAKIVSDDEAFKMITTLIMG